MLIGRVRKGRGSTEPNLDLVSITNSIVETKINKERDGESVHNDCKVGNELSLDSRIEKVTMNLAFQSHPSESHRNWTKEVWCHVC